MNDLGTIVATRNVATSPGACCVSGLMYLSSADAPFLRDAMESVFSQSVPLDQLVVVIDGTLAEAQEGIIAEYRIDPRIPVVDIVRAMSLPEGMNAGLALCSGDWIMRLDGDTISHLDRLAILLDYTDRHPDVMVFSSWCEEFDAAGGRVKVSSIEHAAVVNALRWRNAVIPPSTMISRQMLNAIGGYRGKFPLLTEYDLHVRLVLGGASFRVIPAELITMPARQRHGGLGHIRQEFLFRVFCFRNGFLDTKQFLLITLSQNLFELAGAWLRSRLYKLVHSYPQNYKTSCVIARPNREVTKVNV